MGSAGTAAGGLRIGADPGGGELYENLMGNAALIRSLLPRFIERTERRAGEQKFQPPGRESGEP
jgi:hypothetical protein